MLNENVSERSKDWQLEREQKVWKAEGQQSATEKEAMSQSLKLILELNMYVHCFA